MISISPFKFKTTQPCIAVAAAFLLGAVAADASGFFAYHTKLNTGADFERYSRTDEHPDLVVQLAQPAGRLVFWRGSSYLPYWETTQGKFDLEQIVPRQGDGTATHPDRVNAFSRVWLVEDKPDHITICWRYLPVFQAGNPFGGVDYRNFVEETFVVTPAGQVVRTIQQGTAKLDDWNDPLNQTVVNLALTPSGVVEQSRTLPQHSPPAAGLSYPTKGPPVIAPVREWRFDEGSGDVTAETTTNISAAISGHKSLWRKGVSGTCLQFDGYHSELSLPAAQAPALTDAVTLEAWVAIGAYPWNWCPIIQQGDDDGYFLGVGSHGEAAFKLKVGGTWQELVHVGPLPRFSWLHLTGTYDQATGTMVLYLDGQAVAQRAVTAGAIQTTGDPLRIGMGMPRLPTDSLGSSVDLATYGFDGLIDEVRIYSQALSATQVQSAFTNYRPPTGDLNSPPMDARPLPAFDTGGQFGAHYTRLKYHDVWDNLWRVGPSPDVVVGFDDLPGKFVFWRGAGYIPMLVNEENQWYSNEFNETWGGAGWAGCREPMSDKESLYNHARIIENSPARVVVHWRYPLVDIRQDIANFSSSTGWGDWSDWYYTIYPDGVAVKRMRLWTAGTRNHEWHESMLIMASGQRPADLLESQSPLNHADLAGQTVPVANSKIQVVDLQAEYDPFTIGDFTGAGSFSGGLGWNHWPTSQIPNAGRNAPMPDRASHTSFNHLYLPDHESSLGDAPYQEKIMLEGLSTRSANGLAPLAKSWLQAPAIATLADCQGAAYVPAERAYHLTATGDAPSVRIAASVESPLVNLCLVLKDWTSAADEPARLLIDGVEQPSGTGFRQGIVRDTNGNPVLVVWVTHQASAPVIFTLLTKPTVPTGLTATPGLAAVALNWAQATGATGYKLWQRNTLNGVVQINTVAALFRMNTGLDIGTAYEFRVCATNSSGDGEWSETVSATPTATKGSQTITFTLGPALAMAWNDPPFADPAVASTGLAVTYSTDNPAVATVDAVTGMVTITGIGTAHLSADQAGDAAFLPAPQASQTLTVGKANQTITFDLGPALDKKWNDPPFADPATASSGSPVTYTSDNPNVATVNAETGMVTIVGAGTARLLADQAGDSNHHPAPQVAQTLTARSIEVTNSSESTRIPFVNSGTLVGAAVFGNAGTWDGIPFSLWSPPFTTAKALGAGVSAVASASWNSTTALGGTDQYATVAYTSGSAPGSLTLSGLDAAQTYRFQFGFCDQRVGSYPYSANAVLTLADASTTPVPLSIGASTTADDYALITATVTGSTSLRLDLPQAPNGVGPIIAGFAVHRIDAGLAPSSTDDTLDIKKNEFAILALDDFGSYSDPQGIPLAAVRISTLPSAGSLQFDTTGTGNWTSVTLNQDISAAHISAGRLRFTPAPDATGSPYATIGFAAGNGTLFSTPCTLTITVTASSINATSANSANRIPFINSGTLVGAAVFGNADTYDGIPFSLWDTPFTTPLSLGSGVSVAMAVTGGGGGGGVTGTAFGTGQQYQFGAFANSTPRGMTLTFTGLDSAKEYRFQFGYGDTRQLYAYNEAVTLTMNGGVPVPVQLAFGSAATGDEYALLTATLTNSTSLVLTLPQTVSGFHGPMQAGFSVHQIAPSGYNAWAAANAGGQSADIDHDGDGVPNGIEYFMGATGSTSTAIPPIMHTGGVITWTWPYDPAAAASYKFQLSVDLIDWTAAVTPPDPNIQILTSPDRVRFTLPQGLMKRFCRLAVTPHD